jgi:hypothetical protein
MSLPPKLQIILTHYVKYGDAKEEEARKGLNQEPLAKAFSDQRLLAPTR